MPSSSVSSQPASPDLASRIAPVLDRNIRTLLERREHEIRTRSFDQKVSDRITAFTGSMRFVYLHVAVFASWIIINLGWTPLTPFDPTFVVLAMVASVEAIFLSTFVLISQNRMAEQADKRADLDLQISLLAEHEITHLVQLVSAISDKLGLEHPRADEIEALKQDVAPEAVLDRIEERKAGATNQS